jgi:hypothetical protein
MRKLQIRNQSEERDSEENSPELNDDEIFVTLTKTHHRTNKPI